MVDQVNNRRRFLITVSSIVGGAGVVAATWPFVASMLPSEKARIAGAPVQVDVSKLEPGQQLTVSWRGRPVWVLRRTPDMLARMATPEHLARLLDPDSQVTSQQPAYARNATRSLHPEHLVVIGICTHLGCVPTFRPDPAPADLGNDWDGGYFCPCHGSRYDLAGRVWKNMPAPANLEIPLYHYLAATIVEIGVDAQA